MVHLTETRRMTFYPMAGSVSDQFPYLLKVLKFIQSSKPSRKDFLSWFTKEFNTGKEFARKVFQIILKGCELVHLRRGKLYLTSQGQEVLTTAQPHTLLVCFIKHFGGFEEMFEALLEGRAQSATVLFERWGEKVASVYPDLIRWKQRYAWAQFNHRLNWMRSLGFVETVGGNYLLSSLGLKVFSELS